MKLQVNVFYSSSQAGNFNTTSLHNGSMNSECLVMCSRNSLYSRKLG